MGSTIEEVELDLVGGSKVSRLTLLVIGLSKTVVVIVCVGEYLRLSGFIQFFICLSPSKRFHKSHSRPNIPFLNLFDE